MVKVVLLRLFVVFASAVFVLGKDSVVVFNEIMYHPEDADGIEWIELHNQMSVDVELSGWEITGADFLFPPGTIIPARGFLVVANRPDDLKARTGLARVFGPLTSNLSNSGERLRLRTHNRRVVDQLTFADEYPWSVGPDGTGFSLAKIDPQSGSREAKNWRASEQALGTPGA